MDNTFIVDFTSSEKQFIYSEGVNKGHSLSYSKVNRCLFLSSDAKQLYHNICDYAYGDKKDCYPSHTSLLIELGWGSTKLKQVMAELKASNLITTKAVVGKPTVYNITDLNNVTMLYHSETVYAVISSYKGNRMVTHELLLCLVNKYKESVLFTEVSASSKPTDYREQINKWFGEFTSNQDKEPAPVTEPTAKTEKKGFIPTPINTEGVTLSSDEGEGSRKPKGSVVKRGLNSFDDESQAVDMNDSTSKWSYLHVYKYYTKKYFDTLGNYPNCTVADSVTLKRVMRVKEVTRVIKDIDTFFELDFFVGKSLKSMCSAYIQGVLDEYARSGRLPSTKPKQVTAITKDKELKDWEEGLDDIFIGGGASE